MRDNQISKTVIVADGIFPTHDIPLGYLKKAGRIICCDGSTENLLKAGFEPLAIIGDMDSITKEIADRFKDRVFPDRSQDSNDLTKAVSWCSEREYTDIVIVGATGKREDHTVGNISLLTEYIKKVDVIMVTDTGILKPLLNGSSFSSFPGQQISLFSIDPETEISSQGLRYPLERKKFCNWWVATLNEAMGDSFTLEFKDGQVIVYMRYPGKEL